MNGELRDHQVQMWVILAYIKLINTFNILAYRRHTIMILVSKYTFLRLANPMGTFSNLHS